MKYETFRMPYRHKEARDFFFKTQYGPSRTENFIAVLAGWEKREIQSASHVRTI